MNSSAEPQTALAAVPDTAGPEQRRSTSLDAVRGLAACVVLLAHCYLLVPEQQRAAFDAAPLARVIQPIYNGDAAVVIFFVLSGYVLSLSSFRGTNLGYPRFVLRRICRIWLPFAASVMLALPLFLATTGAATPGASQWFNESWSETRITGPAVLGHLLMVGTWHTMTLNPLMWTLVYEMRISLVFPLLVRLCRSTRAGLLAVATALILVSKLFSVLGQSVHPTYVTEEWVTVLWTVQLSGYFITGILLCKHRALVRRLALRLPRPARACLLLLPLAVFYTHLSFTSARDSVLYDLAAAIVIAVAVESPLVRTLLDRPVPQWLGRVSYSLYLIHLPVMLATVPLLLAYLPMAGVIAVTIPLCLVAAALMHAAIERPAIALSHRLTLAS